MRDQGNQSLPWRATGSEKEMNMNAFAEVTVDELNGIDGGGVITVALTFLGALGEE